MPLIDEQKKQIEEFFAKQKISEIYSPQRSEEIKKQFENLAARWIDDGRSLDHCLKTAEEIFDERRLASRHHTNAMRQRFEILTYERKPGNFKMEEIIAQYGRQETGTNLGSIFGGTSSEVKAIVERNTPIIHSAPVSPFYRNNVFDTCRLTRYGLACNQKRLEVFLESGRSDLTPEEEKNLGRRNKHLHRASNMLESCVAGLSSITNWAGRGVISRSHASQDNRYSNYLRHRNEVIAGVASQLGPNARDGKSYLKALGRVNKILEGSGDLLSAAEFQKIQAMITEELKKEKDVDDKELEKFNQDMQKLNEEMLKKLQGVVDDEDNAWKYRLMQMFLIMTPLGAFSAMGFLSYMDPISQLIGPIFDGATSLGDAIGQMGTSEVLGPFGEIAKGLHLDDAVSGIIEHVPIISDFADIFDWATDNPIAQNLFATIAPLKDSALIPIFIAGGYSLMRLSKEIEMYQKSSDLKETQQKKVEDAVEDFRKKRSEALPKRVEAIAGARYSAIENAFIESAAVSTIALADDATLAGVFAGLQIDVFGPDGKKTRSAALETLRDAATGKMPDTREILRNLQQSSDSTRQQFVDRFLLFSAANQNLQEFQKLQASAQNAKQIQDQQRIVLGGAILDAVARDKGIFVTLEETKGDDAAKKFEKTKKHYEQVKKYLVENDVTVFNAAGQSCIPSPEVKGQNVTNLMSRISRGVAA